jgi:prevent-host-death family protein
MQTFNVHEAKTQLSRLIQMASDGEAFIISRAGKPMVKVVPLNEAIPAQARQLGFMSGQMLIPDDFDTMGAEEIESLFSGS